MLTFQEAYRWHGVSVHTLRRLVRTGQIDATLDTSEYPPRYRISRIDVKRVARQPRLFRPWTDDDDEDLATMLGKVPMHLIERKLNRTEAAIKHRIHRLSLNQRSGDGHYTGSEAAIVLGVTREGILDWIRRGELKTLPHRPVWGRNRCHIIAHEEIERFIRARLTGPPRKKPCWSWKRMPTGYFRNYAEHLARMRS
jgi:hypothetical protein